MSAAKPVFAMGQGDSGHPMTPHHRTECRRPLPEDNDFDESPFDDDDEADDDLDPQQAEIWEPAELDEDDEAEPEYGDFWTEPDDSDD
jgi:hypothetical protein